MSVTVFMEVVHGLDHLICYDEFIPLFEFSWVYELV